MNNEEVKRKKVREILTKLRMAEQPEPSEQSEMEEPGNIDEMFSEPSPEEIPEEMPETDDMNAVENGDMEGVAEDVGEEKVDEEEEAKQSLQKQLAAYFSGMKKSSTK